MDTGRPRQGGRGARPREGLFDEDDLRAGGAGRRAHALALLGRLAGGPDGPLARAHRRAGARPLPHLPGPPATSRDITRFRRVCARADLRARSHGTFVEHPGGEARRAAGWHPRGKRLTTVRYPRARRERRISAAAIAPTISPPMTRLPAKPTSD